MYLKEIWRYPVKSMGGERLERASITPLGIEGDRVVLVLNPQGRAITARSHPALLGHHATTSAEGVPLVDGQPWTSAGVMAGIRKIAGPEAELIHNETAERFDVLPLLVATMAQSPLLEGMDAVCGRIW